MHSLEVTFYHPPSETWRKFSEIQSDQNSYGWMVQENWVAQTYMHLRDAGYPVSLSSSLPTEGIVVFSPACRFAMRRAYRRELHGNLLLVSTRADLLPSYCADFEVLQNGRFADGRRGYFIPHWPQPGLIPRDPSRGSTIRIVAYVGAPENLDPVFRSRSWCNFLNQHGIEWRIQDDPDQLADYSDVDLVLAIRRCGSSCLYMNKPASKLVNAWAAGVPALLGSEYAFREQRHSRLDYVEVDSLEDAVGAVRRLLDRPLLYEAMVRNGLIRSKAFGTERLTAMWAELLFEIVPRRYSSRVYPVRTVLPLHVRAALQFATKPTFGGQPTRLLLGKLLRYVTKRVMKLSRRVVGERQPITHRDVPAGTHGSSVDGTEARKAWEVFDITV